MIAASPTPTAIACIRSSIPPSSLRRLAAMPLPTITNNNRAVPRNSPRSRRDVVLTGVRPIVRFELLGVETVDDTLGRICTLVDVLVVLAVCLVARHVCSLVDAVIDGVLLS